MITIRPRLGPLLSLLGALLALVATAHAGPLPPAIKVVMDDNYPPYVFHDSDGRLQGILIDQWRLWERKTGIKAEVSAMDWGEALSRMRKGEFDVIDTVFKTEERATWLDFSQPYETIEVPIFFNANISGITDAASLKGFMVAVKTGDAAIDTLAKSGVSGLVFFNSYEAVVRAAGEHKVNVFVVDKPPALYFLYRFGIHNAFKHSPPLYVGAFHRAVHKGRAELLQTVEEGFGRISAAELQQIETTWTGSPLVDAFSWRTLFLAAALVGVLLLILFVWNRILRRAVNIRTAELRTSEARFQSIYNSVTDAIFIHDIETGAVLDVNQRMCEMYGCSKEEARTLPVEAFSLGTPPYSRAEAFAWLTRAAAGEPQLFEWLAKNLHGTLFWVEVSMRRAWIGDVERILVTVRDISERKAAAEALKESEQRFRSLFDNALSAVALHEIVLDDQGRPVDYIFLQANPAFARHTGMRVADILGKRVTEVLPGIEKTGLIQTYGRVALTGEAASFELFLELVQRHFSISAYQAGQGRFAVIFNDISESKRAEEELRESEKRYRELFEAESDAVFLIDNESNRILEANGAAAALYGFSREELVSMRNLDLSVEPDATQKATQAPPEVRDQVVTIPLRFHHRKDGTVFPVEITARFFSSRGRSVHIAAIRDISDRQRAEAEKDTLNAQLLQAQKIESVGRLAGGVAHDFNNMLNVILGHTELAMGKIEAEAPIHADLEQIRLAAHRSANLTRQLLAFARKQLIRPKVLDLNETIESMLKILRRLIGEDIHLEWRPLAGLWPVKIDPAQVDQILANLSVNARDAIQGTGSLIIETFNVVADEAFCQANPDCRPGEYCLLTVSDTGMGMDKATIEQIFEPFFTTKEVGKGTGLGLATVYGVVKQNGGFIAVYSETGQGTTFKIYLPRAQEGVEVAATADEQRPAKGSETVLLVEDEQAILHIGARVLTEQGYTVLAASTPGMALELATRHQGEIHLLVTDVVMPEMNGKELAARVSALRPGIKVIFMSGYTADVIAHHGILEEDVEFMAKPFTVREMSTKVRAVLDEVAV